MPILAKGSRLGIGSIFSRATRRRLLCRTRSTTADQNQGWCITPIEGFNTPRPNTAKVLDSHQIIASMSRLANPWDNAKCESFMKTLKREEIHANEYREISKTCARMSPTFVGRLLQHATTPFRTGLQHTRTIRSNNLACSGLGKREDEFFQAWGDLSIRCTAKKEAVRRRPPESIVLMSLLLVIPRRVGLHQSPTFLDSDRKISVVEAANTL